jgi:hypothetical protein
MVAKHFTIPQGSLPPMANWERRGVSALYPVVKGRKIAHIFVHAFYVSSSLLDARMLKT